MTALDAPRATMLSAIDPLDVCACGDYREQHAEGAGRCLLGSQCGCTRFRFVRTSTPEHKRSRAELMRRLIGDSRTALAEAEKGASDA